MRWFRMYDEIIDDPKTLRLKPELRWFYVAILAISNRQAPRGSLPGSPDIAIHLRLSEAKTQAVLEELYHAGFLDKSTNGKTFKVHGWDNRQKKSDNVAERVAAWRENSDVTLQQRCSNDTHARASETEREKRAEREQSAPAPANDFSTLSGREGPDLEDFREAYNILVAAEATAFLGESLLIHACIPGIRSLKGWQLLFAARRISRPDKSKTWGLFERIATDATEAEAKAWGKAVPRPGNTFGAVDYRPTPVVATPSPTSKFAPTPDYAPGEVAKILGLKEHES